MEYNVMNNWKLWTEWFEYEEEAINHISNCEKEWYKWVFTIEEIELL